MTRSIVQRRASIDRLVEALPKGKAAGAPLPVALPLTSTSLADVPRRSGAEEARIG